jgi:hypothetical protein
MYIRTELNLKYRLASKFDGIYPIDIAQNFTIFGLKAFYGCHSLGLNSCQ